MRIELNKEELEHLKWGLMVVNSQIGKEIAATGKLLAVSSPVKRGMIKNLESLNQKNSLLIYRLRDKLNSIV